MPVRDGQDGGVVELAANGLLDERVGGHVHGGGGLVQHQDPTPAKQRPREAEELALAETGNKWEGIRLVLL